MRAGGPLWAVVDLTVTIVILAVAGLLARELLALAAEPSTAYADLGPTFAREPAACVSGACVAGAHHVFVGLAVTIVILAIADLFAWPDRSLASLPYALRAGLGSRFAGPEAGVSPVSLAGATCFFSIARALQILVDLAVAVVILAVAALRIGVAGPDTHAVETDIGFSQVGALATIVHVGQDHDIVFACHCVWSQLQKQEAGDDIGVATRRGQTLWIPGVEDGDPGAIVHAA